MGVEVQKRVHASPQSGANLEGAASLDLKFHC